MKTTIFCLIIFTGFLFQAPAYGNVTSGMPERIETAAGKTDKSFSAAGQDHGPRKKKKSKKKRKTYLDRKVKMRNGHSCPSF
ncbi:MAG TPA: hypothetical protein VFG10_13650 [Saprospiraceae bacterium]|nr:hypothetical protein [Saprospiraceae bacterium]